MFVSVRAIFYSSWMTSTISHELVITGSLSWPKIFMAFSDVIIISDALHKWWEPPCIIMAIVPSQSFLKGLGSYRTFATLVTFPCFCWIWIGVLCCQLLHRLATLCVIYLLSVNNTWLCWYLHCGCLLQVGQLLSSCPLNAFSGFINSSLTGFLPLPPSSP